MGSIRKVNNLQTLVDAARELKNENVHFYIYGDGTEKDMLEEQCRKQALNVKFEGRVEKNIFLIF